MNECKNDEIIRFEEIASTNEYAKGLRKDKKNVIIVAKRQSGGKGTKGRSFSSEEGGLYLTKLEFYTDFLAKDSFLIMLNSAVSVCKTLHHFGLKPVIKWPNDIFVNGKKICGILIENTFTGNKIANSIVGIGLNVYNELPMELTEIATSMYLETGKKFSVSEVETKLVSELKQAHTIEDYRSFLGFMNKNITLILGDERIPATLLCVEDDGRLRASIDGQERVFSSAEVSVRI